MALQKRDRKVYITILIDLDGSVACAELNDITDLNEKASRKGPSVTNRNWSIADLSKADLEMIYESLIAASEIKMTPAIKNGKRIITMMVIPFSFRFN